MFYSCSIWFLRDTTIAQMFDSLLKAKTKSKIFVLFANKLNSRHRDHLFRIPAHHTHWRNVAKRLSHCIIKTHFDIFYNRSFSKPVFFICGIFQFGVFPNNIPANDSQVVTLTLSKSKHVQVLRNVLHYVCKTCANILSLHNASHSPCFIIVLQSLGEFTSLFTLQMS